MEEKEVKESTILRWQAPEFVQYKRDWRWYLAAGIVFLSVIAYSIYTRDWFIIAIALILAGFMVFSFRRSPEDVEYKISQMGIYVNGKLYPYNEIHSFWLILNAEQKVLNVMFNKKYLPELKIIFYGIDPLELKTTLLSYIPEQENRSESLADRLIRILKIN